MPWVLGGCGCLFIIAIIVAVICFAVYRAKQRVSEFKSDFKSSLKELDQTSKALTDPRSVTQNEPKPGWNVYVNEKDKLPASLKPNFAAFRFEYPKSFDLQPQSGVNFVKVEKYTAAGKGNTAENFAVGYARFDDSDEDRASFYDELLGQLSGQFASGFHNYKELKRNNTTVDGTKGYAVLFQADLKDAPGIVVYGKAIIVHPRGKNNGVTIVMLGTSLDRDIKSADDLGTKGDTADIVRSFHFL